MFRWTMLVDSEKGMTRTANNRSATANDAMNTLLGLRKIASNPTDKHTNRFPAMDAMMINISTTSMTTTK